LVGKDPSAVRGRFSRPLWRWLGGISSAVVVALISGVVLNYLPQSGGGPGIATDTTKPPANPSDGSDRQPFTVTTVVRGNICSPYLVDGLTADIPVPEFDPGQGPEGPLTDEQVVDWEKRVGAVPAYHKIVLTIQGESSRAVVLQGIDVVVVERHPKVKPDVVYRLESGCGAAVSPRYFSVDLDGPGPALVPRPGSDEAGNVIPAVAFPFTISSADPEIFIVSAYPKVCDCTWYLRLRWLSGGKSGSTVLDNGGHPFRTAAMDDDSAKVYHPPLARGCETLHAAQVGAWCELPGR
jgi:hypothetical protein